MDLHFLTPQLTCLELDRLPVRSSLKRIPLLEDLFVHINRLYGTADPYLQQALNSLMFAWILQWHASLCNTPPSDRRILRIIDEMERVPERRLSCEALCETCGLEKSYFYELFKKETGITPKTYLLKIKMKKATAMLLESRQSVTSIAEALGYDSIHYFTKQFTAFHGMTPTAFRFRQAHTGQ